MDSHKITLHDQMFINSIMAVVLPVVSDPVKRTMYLDIAADHFDSVNVDHPMIAPIVEAYYDLRQNAGPGAQMDACRALSRFVEWRCGQLQDRLRGSAS